MSKDLAVTTGSPYSEFDFVVEKLRAMTNIWENVLLEEKDTCDRIKRIEKMSGEAREEALYELENRQLGGIHLACMEAIRSFGVEDNIYSVSKLTIAIRYVAYQQISA